MLITLLGGGLHEDLSRIRTKPQYEELKTIVGESVQDGANRWCTFAKILRSDGFAENL